MPLDAGNTSWRTAHADRMAILVGNAAYISALSEVIEAAERSILLIGWQFDPWTRLDPEDRPSGAAGEGGHILRRLVRSKPDLNV